MMISQSALEWFNIIMYVWFAFGALIISVFSIKELYMMIKGKDQ
ncbi:MAG: hypothetical protein Q4F63_03285 [Clostridia bacterium]|nr:hypothetical protein [Clostridia bacterium]